MDQFWGSSLPDVLDTVDAYTRRRKQEIQAAFVQADAIASRIALLFDDGKQGLRAAQPWDYYPELFKDSKEHADLMQEESDLEKVKEGRRRMMQAVKRRNEQREEALDTAD